MAERPKTHVRVRNVDSEEWDWFRVWATRLHITQGELLSALLSELQRRPDTDVRQIYDRYRAPDKNLAP